ncbi:unnamed protein product [Closterium sp. Naga37s-1]|nr:unnamed protein product [Closterium sp. Naga37s-1]
MMDGSLAGLRSGKEVMAEAEEKRAKDEARAEERQGGDGRGRREKSQGRGQVRLWEKLGGLREEGTGGRREFLVGREKRLKDEARQGSGREVMKEAEEKRAKDEARFAQLDPSVSGRGAQTVYRDKAGACGRAVKGEVVADCVCVAGKRVSNLEAIMAEEKAKKSRVLPPPEWGKGLVQKREAERQQADLDAVAARPFAAYDSSEQPTSFLAHPPRWSSLLSPSVLLPIRCNGCEAIGKCIASFSLPSQLLPLCTLCSPHVPHVPHVPRVPSPPCPRVPVTPCKNDEERDRMLKNVVRFGDPMAHLVKVRVGVR